MDGVKEPCFNGFKGETPHSREAARCYAQLYYTGEALTKVL